MVQDNVPLAASHGQQPSLRIQISSSSVSRLRTINKHVENEEEGGRETLPPH